MSGRVALITGAGSGVGRATAIALAARDYHLVLCGRRGEALEQTAAACAPNAETCQVTADVTDQPSVVALFETCAKRFGRLDLLFNNAGVSAPAIRLEDLSFEDWRRVLAINLDGAFLCLREAFRLMKNQSPQGGRIINNGSISATSPRPNSAPYTASKHAITGLTKSASLDGRAWNIACGQIDIGNASSPMGACIGDGALQPNGTVVAEPVFDVSHVGEAVAYMDSLPLEANIQFMTLMATQMPFIGRG